MNENKNENINNSNEESPSRTDKNEFSVLDNLLEKNRIANKERLIEESSLNLELNRELENKREAYAKNLAKEKRELMKARAGLTPEKTEEKVVVNYTLGQKISNFFYHNKIAIIVITLLTALTIFLVIDYTSRENPDVSVMIIVTDEELSLKTEAIEGVFEKYCPDFNGDGKSSVRVSYLPAIIDPNDAAAAYDTSSQIKLMAEFQMGDSIVVISDDYTTDKMELHKMMSNMTEVYPNDSSAFEYGYMLTDTKLAELIEYQGDFSRFTIGFRIPTTDLGAYGVDFLENNANALLMFDNFLNDNVVGVLDD